MKLELHNRLSSTLPILGDHTYTPNSLNQYASLTTGNTRTAIGRAPAAWTVQVAGVAASRTGELYHRSMTASNSTVPVWQSVVTRRDTGTPTMTTNFWYAKASFSPTYDLDGNLTNDGRWVYVWNAENRLIQMETTSQATAAGHPYTKLVFVYDWMGRRIARHVWRGGSQASPTFKSSHRWLYDGWNVITELTAPSSSSTTLTRASLYTWGIDLSGSLQDAGGVGGLVSQTTVASGVKERASYGGNGNIIAWTKSDQSAPTSRREYDAFGNTLVSEGTTPCSFGFSTKMQDVETGLYYYGYRFYDAEHGRWLNRDPIGERGGMNLYGFLANDGLNKNDRIGLQSSLTPGQSIPSSSIPTSEDPADPSEPPNVFGVPSLSVEVLDVTEGECGAFALFSRWHLMGNISRKGIIVQDVSVDGKVIDENGNDITPSDLRDHYREAWPVADSSGLTSLGNVREVRNGKVPQAGLYKLADDQWTENKKGSSNGKNCTSGYVVIIASANFFEGGILPSNFDSGGQSGLLPSTRKDPGADVPPIGGFPSNTVYREVIAIWDCIKNQGSKTKVEIKR